MRPDFGQSSFKAVRHGPQQRRGLAQSRRWCADKLRMYWKLSVANTSCRNFCSRDSGRITAKVLTARATLRVCEAKHTTQAASLAVAPNLNVLTPSAQSLPSSYAQRISATMVVLSYSV